MSYLQARKYHVNNTKQLTSFDVIAQGSGYVVIDVSTGHPVTAEQDYTMACFDRDGLINAAEGGPKNLALALGAIDEEGD